MTTNTTKPTRIADLDFIVGVSVVRETDKAVLFKVHGYEGSGNGEFWCPKSAVIDSRPRPANSPFHPGNDTEIVLAGWVVADKRLNVAGAALEASVEYDAAVAGGLAYRAERAAARRPNLLETASVVTM